MTAIDSHPQPPGTDHAGHHGPHGEYPFLAHHFETPRQQFDAGKLGMWVFLATEVLFFGALFALYAVIRAGDPEIFAYASQYLSTIMGGINTGVLILSSLTMAMAVHFAQRSKRTPLIICLLLTLSGAVGFLVIKYFEYEHKLHAHLVWGPGFYVPVPGEHPEGHPQVSAEAAPIVAAAAAPALDTTPLFHVPPVDASTVKPAATGPAGVALPRAPDAHGHAEHADHVAHLYDPRMPVNTHRFFAIYYAMTGLHGIHVLVGMGLISWLTWGAFRGRFTSAYYTPVDLVGLYWHIVDLIWIFLFPLFYLIH